MPASNSSFQPPLIEPQGDPPGRTFAIAMAVETGLGFAGIAIAWLASMPLQGQLVVTSQSIDRGVLATVPMLVAFFLMYHLRVRPLRRLRRQMEWLVRTVFLRTHWAELLLISVAAGLGEELLFRGALQPLFARFSNPSIGIAVASLLFGLVHAMSRPYFIAATVIGVYFGWLAHAYNDLVAPITAHALYDFLVLVFVQRRVRR